MRDEYIRHLLINTPLEPLAFKLRATVQKLKEEKDPKWQEVRDEEGYMDQALPLLITDTTNCLDVGAHLGAMTSKLRRLARHGVHHIVEPLPYKAEWLRKKFPAVPVHQAAVGDTPGEVEFFYQPNASGFSGLAVHGDAATAAKITVECKKLDDIWPEGTPLGFLKIDIEGGELPALRGAVETLSRWKPIVLFECTETGTTAFNYAPTELYHFLTDTFGYKIYKIRTWIEKGAPLTVEEFDKAIAYPVQALNFLAIPNA